MKRSYAIWLSCSRQTQARIRTVRNGVDVLQRILEVSEGNEGLELHHLAELGKISSGFLKVVVSVTALSDSG
jgi:hypothetical protein